jgi:trehalose 6-phosphate phosphatase
VRDPGAAVVALDFDGVLAPIVPDPDEAYPADGAIDVLGRLAGVLGSLAILTGRPAAFAAERSGIDRLAGQRTLAPGALLVLGHYGVERYDAATRSVSADPVPAAVDKARAAVTNLVAEDGALFGCTMEDKGRSVAVHARRAADPAAAFATMREVLIPLAEQLGLQAEPGRLVVELRPPGMDKGTALRALVAEREARTVVYAGDDLGDVPAFEAVRDLRDQGLVGYALASASTEESALTELADLVLAGPDAVVGWLSELAHALGR